MPEKEKILTNCRQYVTELNLQYQDVRRVLHSDRLSFFLEELVSKFAIAEQVNEEHHFIARLAALFYPIGFRIDTRAPQTAIWRVAKPFLIEQLVSTHEIQEIETTLIQTYTQAPQNTSAQLLSDALIGLHLNTEPHYWANLKQLEYELTNGANDRLTQAQIKLQELLNIRFSTNTGQRYWQEPLGQELLLQKKKLEKILRNNPSKEITNGDNSKHFNDLEEGTPLRAAQTFFRSVYRNHINLSAIADNKANIMISVNSILISVLITFLSYRNIAETQPMILLPVIIFLVVGLSSLVFAVLSARPKVTSKIETTENNTPNKGINIAFFGSFIHIPIDEYEQTMNDALHDSNLLYGNMVRDLYHLGKVLDKKYKYLSISYNIFMMGLVVTVGLFLITLFAT